MLRNTQFSGVCACAIPQCLTSLLEAVEKRSAACNLPARSLELRELDAKLLPIFVVLEDSKLIAIFEKDPVLGDPSAGLLLWVRYKPDLTCDGKSNQHYLGQIDLDVWQSDRFPLTCMEVDWFFATNLQCPDHPWAQLPLNLQLLQVACSKNGKAACYTSRRALSAARSIKPYTRGAPGAPLLKATIWLQTEIAKLDDVHSYGQLFDGWLDRYINETGHRPSCAERSFRQAADGSIARLTQK